MSREYSLNEKIGIAFRLASQVADLYDKDNITNNVETLDLVYGHADGLFAKRLYDIRDGRCSIATSIAFDSEAEEKQLDTDIMILKALKKSLEEVLHAKNS